jgi:hypothetical protein
MKIHTIGALAAAFTWLALGAGAAQAQTGEAEARTSLNVRSGPGTGYGVVDVLRPGENVRVSRRSGSWCHLVKSGPDGWSACSYLRFTGEVDIQVRPNVSFSFSFGRGDGFSIGLPPRGGRRDLVCLVTFFQRDQVAAGRDADVQRARVMTREEAERRDTPNDRQAIFDYGTNRQTRETCQYLNSLNNRPPPGGGGGDGRAELVCLVTFFQRDQVEAGRDADVQRARVMSREEAEERDTPNDRQRIFDYGSNRQTRETCQYLDGLNNQPPDGGGGGGDEDLVCLVTFFQRDQVEAGRDADVQRARVMSRAEAEERDTPNDRQAIFDYGSNQQTRETCEYLDGLN